MMNVYILANSVETYRLLFGAGDEARTRDIQLGRLKLYQLSYSRLIHLESTVRVGFPPLFPPSNYGFAGSHAVQLIHAQNANLLPQALILAGGGGRI
jgi:hypothetical protein